MPACITGMSGTLRTEPINCTLMVCDPKDSQHGSGLSGWGQDGINLRLALQFPVQPGSLTACQTVEGMFSTKDSIDRADSRS